MKVYTASGWIAASSASVATLATFEFVATSGQTVFTGADANSATLSYVAPALIVTLNGVRLRPGDDYTATNGTSITLVSAAALNDELVVDAFGSFLVANTYTIAEADALLAAKSNTSTTVTKDSSTGAANIPSGTTAQRPGGPTTGQTRFNTSLGSTEIYNGSNWQTLVGSGTTTTYNAEYLVVAGGGGGGQNGGGGGGGGMIESSGAFTVGTAYTITAGAGGSANTKGTDSSISGSGFTTITATGGGRGGPSDSNGSDLSGGSGGGGGRTSTVQTYGGTGVTGQGNRGGWGAPFSGFYPAGGGGGAGSAGLSFSSGTSGDGGAGRASSISGSAITYSAGGGASGSSGESNTPGWGGTGGGGNGSANSVGGTGSTNTGSGGGGGNGGGGTGGSGIIIISYPGAQRGTGGTITSVAGNTIHTFTSSGTFTA